jgi:hypothetical protein
MKKSRSLQLKWLAVTAGLALPGALAVTGYALAAGHSPQVAVKVRSNLDGRSVLPRRIRWTASVNVPQSQVGIVGFLIDGKPKWFTEKVPATFDGDGYLVTSWLSPGPHSFTVRLRTSDHQVIDDTVVARVAAAPAPPAALAGTWQRTINGADAPANPANRVPPTGRYKLVFDKAWIQTWVAGTFDPSTSGKTGAGLILENDWTPGTSSFQAFGDVIVRTPQDVNRDGGRAFCDESGPAARYTWSVSGNTLTLTPAGGSDACAIRGFLWAGQWTRVG